MICYQVRLTVHLYLKIFLLMSVIITLDPVVVVFFLLEFIALIMRIMLLLNVLYEITLKRYIARLSRITLIGVQHVTLKFSTGPGSSKKKFSLTNLDSSPQIYPKMLYLKVWPSNTFLRPITCGPQACYRPLVTAAVLNFQPSSFSYIVL